MSNIDVREFRNALGTFATGVTIVTTMDSHVTPVGVTASSFNSVSLDPPLVLWSLAKKSLSLEAFRSAGHFAVHVLSNRQVELSNQFARSGGDKFAGVTWAQGAQGSPLLEDCAARFQCKTQHQYEGGDHIIFVGEVIAFEDSGKAPLLFHGGTYADSRPKPKVSQENSVDEVSGRISNNFFSFLLARAHFQLAFRGLEVMRAANVSEKEVFVLGLLSMNGALSLAEIRQRMLFAKHDVAEDDLSGLHKNELIDVLDARPGEPNVFITARGRQVFVQIASSIAAIEGSALSKLSESEVWDLKLLLQRVIDATSDGIPKLWD